MLFCRSDDGGKKRTKSLNYVMSDKKNVFVFYSLLLKDILDLMQILKKQLYTEKLKILSFSTQYLWLFR